MVPDTAAVLCVSADAALVSSALVQVVADGPWSDHVVALHPSVVWALAGDASRDPDLPPLRGTRTAGSAHGDALTVVAGPDRERRRTCAIDSTAGERFLVVGAPDDRSGWAAIVREATLTGCGIVVELDDDHLSSEGRRWIERTTNLPWAISSRADLPIEELPDRQWKGFTAERDRRLMASGTPRSASTSSEPIRSARNSSHASLAPTERSTTISMPPCDG